MKVMSFSIRSKTTAAIDTFISHLVETEPDVVCLQKVLVSDFDTILKPLFRLYPHYIISAQPNQLGGIKYGVAIFSRLPIDADSGTDIDYKVCHVGIDDYIIYNVISIFDERLQGAPNSKQIIQQKLDNDTFYFDLIAANSGTKQKIVCGNFSCYLSTRDYNTRGIPEYGKSNNVKNLAANLKNCDLSDAYRIYSPFGKEFTNFVSNNAKEANSGSRTSYIFIDNKIKTRMTYCIIPSLPYNITNPTVINID